MTKPRNVPLWFDRVPATRRPSYPKYRGESRAAVVVVGGGLTGCACAWSFAAAGHRVILLETERVGASACAASAGIAREDLDGSFQASVSAHGLRAARSMWQDFRRASLDLAAVIRRLRIRCDLAPRDLLRLAALDARDLRKEYQARRDAGLAHTWVTQAALRAETGLDAPGAIRTRGHVLDPYRACLALAAAAAARQAEIYEHSPVTRIRPGRRHVEVRTDRGGVEAEAVVVATSAALPELQALRRHLRASHGYAVVTEPLPAGVRRELGGREASLQDDAEPPHLLQWLNEDRVLFSGAHQSPVPDRARSKVLVQRTGQLMYELSTMYPAISGALPEWAWDFVSYDTADGLPLVGPHRRFPRHLFALGEARHGPGVAWLAARALLRHFQESPTKGDQYFGFGRILG